MCYELDYRATLSFKAFIGFLGILLMFIREINSKLPLAAFRFMTPWFFACDRTNYARYVMGQRIG